MTELLTAAQMRAIEKAAIDSGQVTGLELMERAGRGVVEAVFAEWPELAGAGGAAPRGADAPCPPEYFPAEEPKRAGPRRAVVLCGPGNNGGDGFVVARLLKERGWEVEAFLYGDAEKLPPDARRNHERWDGAVSELRPNTGFDPWSVDLIVDAVFGTGLTRGLSWDAAIGTFLPEWDLRHVSGRPRVVAVDLPSGLCSDSGKCLEGDCLWADLTVTFHTAKPGHFLGTGPFHCGRVVVADIGLKEDAGADERGALLPGFRQDRVRLVSEPLKRGKSDPFGRATHKYTHGHALILSGPTGKGGAARLAARGALRIGAGLVTVGCPPEALAENAAQLNAIMLEPVADAGVLGAILQDERMNALCLGPGLGLDDRAVGLVSKVLGIPDKGHPPAAGGGEAPAHGGGRGLPGLPPGQRSPSRSLVLDADALTILSREPDLFAALHDKCVLTPHAGEFARLFPAIAEKLNAPATRGPAYSKVDATRDAAARAGCVVLFKGPDTVIADPDGRCSINSAQYERAAPWLATAGSGDVLAGFIAGLLARGFAPMQAAETAAWLHVECALKFGPGLIAEDLPEVLPAVFSALGL